MCLLVVKGPVGSSANFLLVYCSGVSSVSRSLLVGSFLDRGACVGLCIMCQVCIHKLGFYRVLFIYCKWGFIVCNLLCVDHTAFRHFLLSLSLSRLFARPYLSDFLSRSLSLSLSLFVSHPALSAA